MDGDLDIDRDEKIDLLRLEIDWQDQARLFNKYARALVVANRKQADVEGKKDAVEARLYIDIKLHPKNYFGDDCETKLTDKAIKSMILTQDEYKNVLKEYNDAVENQESIKSMVETMKQRKSALENEVSLHGQAYFAGPRVPNEVAREARRSIDQATEEHVRELVTAPSRRRRTDNDAT